MGWPIAPGVAAAGHCSASGFWHPGKADGCLKCSTPPRIFTVTREDVDRCPRSSLAPSHYRLDGSCECFRQTA